MIVYSGSECECSLACILDVAFETCDDIYNLFGVAADVVSDCVFVVCVCACDFCACNEVLIKFTSFICTCMCSRFLFSGGLSIE